MNGIRVGVLACVLAAAGCGDGGDAGRAAGVPTAGREAVARGHAPVDANDDAAPAMEAAIDATTPPTQAPSETTTPAAGTSTGNGTPSERDVRLPGGGLGPDTNDIVRGEDFPAFIAGLRRDARTVAQRERAEVYRQAIEQTLSEFDGATPPVAFECGVDVCAGILESATRPEWIGAWQASLMQDQLAPIRTMALHELKRDGGAVQHRFVFTTSGPGRVVQRAPTRGDAPPR